LHAGAAGRLQPAAIAADRHRAPVTGGFATPGKRLVLAVTTFTRRDYLKECLNSWAATRNPAYHWLVIIADDGSSDGTLEDLKRPDFGVDCHVIRNERRSVGGQCNTIFDVCRRLKFDVGFKVDDDIVFKKPGWDELYLKAMEAGGFQHLCHLNLKLWNSERRPRVPLVPDRPLKIDPSGRCVAYTDVYNCMGCFFTFTPDMLAAVGDVDEANFPIRGDWHIDYSARSCRAGFNRAETFFDAAGSNDYIDIQNNLKSIYRPALAPQGPEMAATLAPAEIERRQRIVRDEQRIFVSRGV
jgi:glycosyltransferase involved in cell wall biosynthesis